MAPEIPNLFLRCFGAPALLARGADGEETVMLGAGNPLRLLACLEAHPAGTSRQQLAALCWGDRDERHARASLRQVLVRLRQVLGADRIATDDDQVLLVTPLASDRAAFVAAVARGDDLAACAIYCGPFLDGIESVNGDGVVDQVAEERARFAVLWRDAAIRLCRAWIEQGDMAAAAALAADVTRAFPGAVAAWAVRLEALTGPADAGRRRDALAQLESLLRNSHFDPESRRAAALLHRRFASGTDAAESPTSRRLPLVGRQPLLRRLVHLAAPGAAPDEPRVIVLEGSAGLGKTRVLRELVDRLGPHGCATVFVAALPSERRTRWALLNRVVRSIAALPGASGIERASAGTLVRLDPELAARFPAASAGDAPPEIAELTAAVADLFSAVHAEAPLVLLLDDLHLGDPDSLQLLESALEPTAPEGVLAITAARPWHRRVPVSWPRWQLTPLDLSDLVALVDLALPGVPREFRQPMADQLLLITGGIPFYVRRAFRLLVDGGVLRPDGAGWLADHPAQVDAAIARLSLQRDPLFPRQRSEQALLGYLEVAEEPVGRDELTLALATYPPGDLGDLLERSAQAGWLYLDDEGGGSASLAHAVVAEQVRHAVPPEMRVALQLRRAEWLHRYGTTLVHLQAAVRLYRAVGYRDDAIAAVRDWRRRVGRGVRGLADLVVPDEAGRLFRWRMRLAASTWEFLLPVGAIAAALLLLAGGLWWRGRPAELRLENRPVVVPIDTAHRASSNTEPPIFTVRDHVGRITNALDGEPLAVRIVSGGDSIFIRNVPVARAGSVEARSIDLWAPDVMDSVVAEFSIGSLRSDPVVLARGWSHASLKITGGVLAGRALEGPRPTIHVAAGEPVDGLIVLRYTTPSVPVTYILAETSTFGSYRTDTATVISLLPGALGATVSVHELRTAPVRPGAYWIVWAVDAEPSAVWILSRTNWQCGKPDWSDGNNVVAAPDSLLGLAWGGDLLRLRKRFCPAAGPVEYRPLTLPVAAVQVVVGPD